LLGGGHPHLAADLFVAGDGQAGRSGGLRIDGGELLGGRQAYLASR